MLGEIEEACALHHIQPHPGRSGLPKIASIQNSYSLIVRGAFETDLAETCSPRNANVGLLAYSPLAGELPIQHLSDICASYSA